MTLLIVSFLAGVLTVAAPCVLPLLPIVIGGSVVGDDGQATTGWRRSIGIVSGLVVSVIVFTLLLKASTVLLGVPAYAWQVLSGGLIIMLGLAIVWPRLWEKLTPRSSIVANRALGKASRLGGCGGAFLTGAALGPVFNSCSPTYALIVAAVLPASFVKGLLYLAAYSVGLGVVLLFAAGFGRSFVARLGWLSNPNGWFKRTIGVVFIAVGLLVLLGLDKSIQTYVLENGWYNPVSTLEERLRH